MAPTTPVSPFPWTQLYLAELEGQRLKNYYHWLALTYVVTLVTNPSISLPCGRTARTRLTSRPFTRFLTISG